MTKSSNFKRSFQIFIIFALVVSLITPFSINKARATEVITVAEAIANNSGTATVEGYIVGTAISGTSYDQTAPFSSATNLGLADSPNETDPAKIMPVQLPSGNIRTDLNLVDNPNNLGKKVRITGTLTAYFSVPGHKSATSYSFVYESNPTQVQAVEATPTSGAVQAGTTVSLTTATVDATIYYTADGIDPTTASTEYKGPITINEATTIKAIAVKDGLADSTVSTFNYTIEAPPTIVTIAEARSQKTGEVTVKGIVTAKLKNTIQIQDESGAIAVRPTSLDVELGDEITVSGSLGEYNGLLQLNNSTIIEKTNAVGVPTPIVLTGIQLTEEHESKLATVNNVIITGSPSNYDANDNTAKFIVRDENNNLNLVPGTTYESITGIVQEFKGAYQILPRSTADIVGEIVVPEVPTEKISIADARSKAKGETVIIEGIVTTDTGLWGGSTFYMQDETAGMFIYPSSASVKPGDKVRVTGQLTTYSNEVELENTTIEFLSSGNVVPEPIIITPTGVNEATQGELVKLENITISELTEANYGTAEFQAEADNGEKVLVVHDNRTGSDYNELIKHYNEGDKVHLIGIAAISSKGYILKTLGLESYDLVNKPAVYVTQSPGTVPMGTKIELKSGIEGAEIYYTTDGSVPSKESAKYSEAIALGTGETTIKAIAISGESISEVFSFTYKILNTEGVIIRDIQGNNHTSDYVNSTVQNIIGVVTYVQNGSLFVIQDVDHADEDHATSEAIMVSKSSHGVSVGDKVSVNGAVTEYGSGSNLTSTQINATSINSLGKAELPNPIVIGTDVIPPNKIIDNDSLTSFNPEEDGIDFWESLEYMLVSFPNAKIIGPPYSGDVPIVVESTTNNTFNVNGGLNIAADDYNPEKIFLDNVGSKNYESGDQFNGDVIGVISYSSTGYQLRTDITTLPEVTKANIQQEVTHIDPTEDKLTVAAYNVENFSNNKSNTPDVKVAKIAKTFVDNMKSPDIITLVEVQDNDGQTDSGNADASESYNRLIEAIKVAGGPTYQWTDVTPVNNTVGGAPGGNIRVGYLYNPLRVSLVEGTKGTGSQGNTWTEEGNLALNPGFIDPTKFTDTRKPIAAEFEFQGERVVVIGTHLNSKGGDQSLWGSNQPPKLSSEAERLSLAKAINEFIDEGLAKNPNLNIVLAGDMNDFEFTPVLETLKGGVLTNMVDHVPTEDRFSYFFQGNNQVLDHILVSNNLVDATTVDMIHINANFTEDQGQASDHDAVLVQIDLSAAGTVNPIHAEKVYNLTNFKTNKLTITKPSVKVNLDGSSSIKEGLFFTGSYIELHGEGFATHTVTIQPNEAGAIVDLKGTELKELIVDGNKVKEIRGAENIQTIKYIEGTNGDSINIINSGGAPIGDPSLPFNDYYATAQGKSGEELKFSLHEIISEHEFLTYSEVWDALKITDEDPNNPNNVLLFYSGISRSKNENGGNVGQWNREHVWAKSHGDFGTTIGPGTDIHHLRPTDVLVNSSRGNLDFDTGGSLIKGCSYCLKDGDSFEPPNYVKGDVARILFYMAVRYEKGDLVDLELNDVVNNGENPYHGKLSVLLEWHLQDPVDDFERNRNNVIQELQGNRNPFIDYPEWAHLIWAN